MPVTAAAVTFIKQCNDDASCLGHAIVNSPLSRRHSATITAAQHIKQIREIYEHQLNINSQKPGLAVSDWACLDATKY